jgi:hypothetical protein
VKFLAVLYSSWRALSLSLSRQRECEYIHIERESVCVCVWNGERESGERV